jgi:glycosyltransferase involved in cell wall biosynthesis
MNRAKNDIPPQMCSHQDTVLVSIVIPAYNSAVYISNTLNSVFAQTFTNYEIIVVNDGSPDTPALEHALHPYRSRIRYLRQENRGPSGARNTAIRAARGKYVALLDSDDLWLPQHLAKQVRALEKDPSLGLVYANAVYLEGDIPVGLLFDCTPQSLPVDFDALLQERSTVSTSSAVVSRQALVQAGLFDEQFRRCEDYDLWLRLAHGGVRMTFTRDIQIYHRLANGLAANGELMKQALIEVYKKTLATQPLTDEQVCMIRKKITVISMGIELARAKQSLLAGQFHEALEFVRTAQSAASNWRLWSAQFGLRFFPRLLQSLYVSHLRRLERRELARRARSLKKVGFAGRPVNLTTVPGPTVST